MADFELKAKVVPEVDQSEKRKVEKELGGIGGGAGSGGAGGGLGSMRVMDALEDINTTLEQIRNLLAGGGGIAGALRRGFEGFKSDFKRGKKAGESIFDFVGADGGIGRTIGEAFGRVFGSNFEPSEQPTATQPGSRPSGDGPFDPTQGMQFPPDTRAPPDAPALPPVGGGGVPFEEMKEMRDKQRVGFPDDDEGDASGMALGQGDMGDKIVSGLGGIMTAGFGLVRERVSDVVKWSRRTALSNADISGIVGTLRTIVMAGVGLIGGLPSLTAAALGAVITGSAAALVKFGGTDMLADALNDAVSVGEDVHDSLVDMSSIFKGGLGLSMPETMLPDTIDTLLNWGFPEAGSTVKSLVNTFTFPNLGKTAQTLVGSFTFPDLGQTAKDLVDFSFPEVPEIPEIGNIGFDIPDQISGLLDFLGGGGGGGGLPSTGARGAIGSAGMFGGNFQQQIQESEIKLEVPEIDVGDVVPEVNFNTDKIVSDLETFVSDEISTQIEEFKNNFEINLR